jgi:hypothetical protein
MRVAAYVDAITFRGTATPIMRVYMDSTVPADEAGHAYFLHAEGFAWDLS